MNSQDHSAKSARVPGFPTGLDDLRSTDKCPMCFAQTHRAQACPSCGLNLQDSRLAEVFTQSTIAADALVARGNLVAKAWHESPRHEVTEYAQTPSAPPVPPAAAEEPAPPAPADHRVPQAEPTSAPVSAWAEAQPQYVATPVQAQQATHQELAQPQIAPHPAAPAHATQSQVPATAAPTAPAKPRRSGIQLTLLVLGVSFVSIAAIVFLTVAFVLFDLVVKSLITAGVTAAVIALASWLKHRRLTTTAEGIAILGVVLLILDLWAIRSLNLFGLEQIQGNLFWGVGLLLMTGILLGWGKLASLRAPRIASTFTIGPGIVAMLRWIFDWVFTEHSSTLIALAGLAIASVLAPILHKRADRPDALEVGIVFGIGQLGALALVFQALGRTFAGNDAGSSNALLTAAPHPLEEPIVAIVTAGIGIAALLWLLKQLRNHDSLAPIQWQRISATILTTLLWATAILVAAMEILAPATNSVYFGEVWKALPVIALAAVYWDFGYLRTNRADRTRWLSGVITTAVIIGPPTLWLGAAILQLPLHRATSTTLWEYSIEWSVFGTGIALIVAAAVAFLVYRTLPEATSIAGRRLMSAAIVIAVGLTVTAIALPLWASLVVLGLLLVATMVAIGAFCRHNPSPLRTVILTAYTTAAVGLALVTFLHRPLVMFAFAAIGLGFLAIRLLLGARGPVLMTLAAALFAALTTAVAWAPIDFPYASVLFAPALPIVMLLIAVSARKLDVTDRRVLAWTASSLLFITAAQQIPLALADPGGPLSGDVWPLILSMVIALIALGALLLVSVRSTRFENCDLITHSVALTAAMPLGYIVMSPFVQLLARITGAAIYEVLFVWALVTGALLATALLTLLRQRSVPGVWTRATDCIAVVAAFLAMMNLLGFELLSNERLTYWAVLALALAIAVPLTVTVRSAGAPHRGKFRGTFPWIAAGFLALFGPVLVQRLVEAPWPVLVTAPIALSLLVSALVFGVSGSAARIDHGHWPLGGMLALGTAIPLASLLGSREQVFDGLTWPVSTIVAVLALAIATLCAFWQGNPALATARLLLVTLLAPLGAMSLITAVSDLLETLADAGPLAPTATGYALAAGIGVAIWLGLALVSRGVSSSAATPAQGGVPAFTPTQILTLLSIATLAMSGFAALMLPPLSIEIALAAWAIAIALVLTPKPTAADASEWAPLIAFILRALAAGAVLVAAISALYAATLDQHLAYPALSTGTTLAGLALALLLFMSSRRSAQSMPTHPTSERHRTAYRVLSMVVVPVTAWAGLITVPVAWSWWMPTVAAVIAVAAALAVALQRNRLEVSALAAAGVSALLPVATALAVTDARIRVWPFTWLIVGISLVIYGFAIRHTLAGFLRGAGMALALVSSAILLWPDSPNASVLFVAAPGCALLLCMAIIGALSGKQARTMSKFEAGAYALAAPLWFAGVAVAAASVITGNTFAVIMIVMLCLSVGAIAGFWFTETKRPELHFPLQLFAVGSGIAAVVTFIAAIVKESDTPGDVYFLAFGLALTAVGALWMRSRPALRSFPALGPGLVIMLLPLWFYEANDPTAARIGIYTLLVLTAVLVGALGKLQAPLVLGTIAAVAHLIVAIRWMLPELSVPWWIWLGAAGALLIFVAATYESRIKNAKAVVTSISQLR
ncbi:SCO7613 C-terminal domain-containing membrane protein [Gulosibacter chungangensis]|uniref:DUF2157 domain-containing protein n=1 Tax=Gulosibacter chungangensis TaxID=979746 RepID=A0A7J5BCS1_9MICO|nr:hypothetical protein [Gulosibacter chungangensis]KAB1642741.1 hypothetical protein F8O05_09820 [Gulosibacter chungangensis]